MAGEIDMTNSDTKTITLSAIDCQKVNACILFAINDYEKQYILDPNNYEVKNILDYYRNLAKKFVEN